MNKAIRTLLSLALVLAMLTATVPAQALAAPAGAAGLTSISGLERVENVEIDFVPAETPGDGAAAFPEPVGMEAGDADVTGAGNAALLTAAPDKAPLLSNTSGNYTYTVSEGEATITAYSGSNANLTVPDKLDGYPVVGIAGEAFCKNNSLKSVILPEGLKTLGYHAFSEDTLLESVYIPKTLESADRPFVGCGRLTSVTFGAGITEIVDTLFDGCGLTQMEIPATVTRIGEQAFLYCKNLAAVDFNDKLEEIGTEAFCGCTALVKAELPEGLKTLGHHAFSDDTLLESVYIPVTLERAERPFVGCGRLTSVTFGAGITEILDTLLDGCGLTHIEIPATVTRIGEQAFLYCKNLKTCLISSASCVIEKDAFFDCGSLVLYCPYSSLATVYAIDHEIPFESSGVMTDSDSFALDHTSGTGLYADLNSMTANGCVTLTLNYSVKEQWTSRVSDLSAHIRLPSCVELDEDTIKLDGAYCKDYELDETMLTVPLSNTSGTIKMSVRIVKQGKITCYAVMELYKDDEPAEEIIGIINESADVLTMSLPGETSQATFDVNGLAPASSTVSLYVNGVLNTTAAASRAGSWTATLTLPDPKDNHRYTVSAAVVNGGETVTKEGRIVYKKGAAKMTEFLLQYHEHDEIKTCDLLHTGGIKPVVYFVPGTEFKFIVEYDAPEQINQLYVTSTRNGEKKFLKAEYDKSRKAFVTNGFFDPSDQSYIPGTISIEYTRNLPEVRVGQSVDWDAFPGQPGVDAGKAVNVRTNTDKDYQATIDLSEFSSDLEGVFVDASISILDDVMDSNLEDWLGAYEEGSKIVLHFLKGVNGEEYELLFDYRNPNSYVAFIHEISDSKIIKLILDNELEAAQFGTDQYKTLLEVSGFLSTVGTVTGLMVDQYEIRKEAGELREEVMQSSGLSIAERRDALKKVDEYEYDKSMFTLITALMPLVVAAPVVAVGATMSAAPLILFTAILGVMTACAPIFWEYRVNQIKGNKFRLSWVADPSGYVYDLETMERIEGVQTTAYYIPYDETDDFWSRVPGDDTYGTMWNAEEYDQENPLTTNSDGKYAWDVPEGWWRVRYEKEGYETTWSDWMTVPPVQTEVNIGMKSSGQGIYVIALAEQTEQSLTVRLTNRTESASPVVFAAAAYSADGRMVAFNSLNASPATGESVNLSLPLRGGTGVKNVKAFVLSQDALNPLRRAWTRKLA